MLNKNDLETSKCSIEVSSDTKFTECETERLKVILQSHTDVFATKGDKIGVCKLIKHKLHLKPGAVPFRRQQYRLSPLVKAEAQKQINEFLQQGVIEPLDSEWNSPLIVVPKGVKKSRQHMAEVNKAKSWRIVTDLRELNKRLITETRTVPNIDDLIDSVTNSYNTDTKPVIFSLLDIKHAYYQCMLDEESRHMTAFTFNNVQYGWARWHIYMIF